MRKLIRAVSVVAGIPNKTFAVNGQARTLSPGEMVREVNLIADNPPCSLCQLQDGLCAWIPVSALETKQGMSNAEIDDAWQAHLDDRARV